MLKILKLTKEIKNKLVNSRSYYSPELWAKIWACYTNWMTMKFWTYLAYAMRKLWSKFGDFRMSIFGVMKFSFYHGQAGQKFWENGEDDTFLPFLFFLFGLITLNYQPYNCVVISKPCHPWHASFWTCGGGESGDKVVIHHFVITWSSLCHAYVTPLHHAYVIICIINPLICCTWWSYMILLLWLGFNP